MINILFILVINNITTKTKRNKILIHKNIWKEEDGYKNKVIIFNNIVSSELDIKTNILLLEKLFFYSEVK